MDIKNAKDTVKPAICYIFGAAPVGDIPALSPTENDIIIAADGGLNAIQKSGLKPDIVLGDFDSLGKVPNVECELMLHPVEKDDTDTGLAVKTAISRGYERIFIFGGMGGERPDHTIANLQTLVYIAKHRAIGFLTDGKGCFTAISGESTLIFPADYEGGISVFSAEGLSEGVTLKNLYYPLDNAVLSGDFPLGVSNSFLPKNTAPHGNSQENAEISVKKGTLLIYFECKNKQISEYPVINRK